LARYDKRVRAGVRLQVLRPRPHAV